MKILHQIVLPPRGRWQIAGAAVGAFLGLFLLLLAAQFYFDLSYLTGGEGQSDDRYVIINKQVNLFNTLGVKATFSEEDVEKISAQPFVQSVGVFESNKFRVSASSSRLGFYTELFFEAVPDQYLDLPEKVDFQWTEGDAKLPVVLSRDYLALYNFGFAPSQGLPQFTPGTIKQVTMDITLRGRGRRQQFQGRIVGFSDRINSILVPESFMEWANDRFGDEAGKGPSRLMLEVSNPYVREFEDFLQKNGYEVSSGRLIGGQVGALLKLVIALLALIGGIIVLLSVLVFLLIFRLLIAQAVGQIRLLLELGYRPSQISRLLLRRFGWLFGGVVVAALALLIVGRLFQRSWFASQGFELGSLLHPVVMALAVALILLIAFLNVRNIRQNVLRLFP